MEVTSWRMEVMEVTRRTRAVWVPASRAHDRRNPLLALDAVRVTGLQCFLLGLHGRPLMVHLGRGGEGECG